MAAVVVPEMPRVNAVHPFRAQLRIVGAGRHGLRLKVANIVVPKMTLNNTIR